MLNRFQGQGGARRGVGRALLNACTNAARAAGFRSLTLMATLPGVPFYAALGFTTDEDVVEAFRGEVERLRQREAENALQALVEREDPPQDGHRAHGFRRHPHGQPSGLLQHGRRVRAHRIEVDEGERGLNLAEGPVVARALKLEVGHGAASLPAPS